MATEDLGTAVLTLTTNPTQLKTGLAQAKQEIFAFRKDAEATAKATSAAFKSAITPVPPQTSDSFKRLFTDVRVGATTSGTATDKLRASFVGAGEAAAAATAKQVAGQKQAAAATEAHTVAMRKQIDAAQATATAFRSVGTTLTAAFTVPIVGAAAASVKFATDFQRDMTKVGTLSNIAAEDVAVLKKSVLDLAPQVGQGPDALAQALLVVTSVGIKGAAAMDILRESAKASAAGLGETRDIARAVASAITAYGKENLTAAEATNKLFIAVQEGGADADEFANTLGRVVGTAAQVGVTFDEVVTSIATFTRLGVRADEAVTALRGELSLLLKPSSGAREELDRLGFSITEVRHSVEEHGLADTLIKLIELTDGNDDSLGKIIPNVRALAGVLANTGEQAGAYREILERVKTSHGDLDKAFEETTKTAAFKWEEFKSKLQQIAIEIGDQILPKIMKLAPIIESLLDKIGALVDEFSKLPGGVQTFAEVTLGVLAVGGPVMLALGTLLSTWAQIRTAILLAKAAQVGFGAAGVAGAAGGTATGMAGRLAIGAAGAGSAGIAAGIGAALYSQHLYDTDEFRRAQNLASSDDPDARLAGEQMLAALIQASMPSVARPNLTSMMAPGAQPTDLGLVGGVLPPKTPPKKLTKAEQEKADKVEEAYKQSLIDLQEETDRVFAGLLLAVNGRRIGTGMATTAPSLALIQGLFGRGAAQNPFGGSFPAAGPAKIGSKTFDTGAAGSFATDLFSAVPGAIQAAIQGGGSKLQAAGSAMGAVLFGKDSSATQLISGGITKLFGKDGFLGKTLSSAVPIIGSMIGPAIEGLGKLWGKVFGTAGRDAVRDFASKSGGFEALHARLGTLGAEGEQLWKTLTQGVGRNNPEQAKAAIEKVEAAFAAFEQGVRQAEGAVANIGSRLEHVTDISPEVKAGLQDALNAKTPQDFLAALTNVNGLLDATAQKHQHLKDLADKYGISLKNMGHAFAQGEIDAMAQVLLQDFADLTAEGVDSTAILKGMKDKYNELVQAAKESGAEIPLSMKPTLQKLLDMGELVDKDGQKLSDLDDLNFGDSLETRLGDIKDAVIDLKRAIEDLALAFRGLPSNLPAVPASPSPRGQADRSGDEDSPDRGGFNGAEGSARGSFVRPWGLQYLSAGGLATAATIAALSMAPIYAARGFEPRGTDTVPAMTTTGKRLMLTPGEGIVSTLGMSNLGVDGLRAYNRGELPLRGGMDTSRMEAQLASVQQELREQTSELASIRDAVLANRITSVQANGRELLSVHIDTVDNNVGGGRTQLRQALGIGS